MKRTLLVAAALLLAAQAALAQAGAICIFADPGGTDCSIRDDSPGTLTLYVVHMLAPGAMAAQFSAPKPQCMTGATWLSDTPVFPVTLGNSQTGVSIGYGTCLTAPIHVLTMTYVTSGSTQADCLYRVLPHTAESHVNMVDCDNNLLTAGGGRVFINSNLECVCTEPVTPALVASPDELDFGKLGSQLTFQIINAGDPGLGWSLSKDQPWLTATPSTGTDDATITVRVDRSQLVPGEQEGHVFVDWSDGSATVTVHVMNDARLTLSPKSLDFGATLSVLTFSVGHTGTSPLYWTTSESLPWVTSVLPPSGIGDATVRVTINRSGMPAGAHTGTIYVNSNGGFDTINVAMSVQPVLAVTPTRLDFGPTVVKKTLSITNAGSGTLTWSLSATAPWISAVPSSGTGNAAVTVTVDRSGLPIGYYEAEISISSNGGPATVPVTMNVSPVLSVSPTSLFYGGPVLTQMLWITNVGWGTLVWSAAPDASWITVAPPSGTGNGILHVTASRCDIPPGTFWNSSVTVTSNGGNKVVPISAMGMIRLDATPGNLLFAERNPPPQTIDVQTVCTDSLDWLIEIPSGVDWIHTSPTSGSARDTVTVWVTWPANPSPDEVWESEIVVVSPDRIHTVPILVQWAYGGVSVPVQPQTWGRVKSKYQEPKK